MIPFLKPSKGYKYIITIIKCFSKYTFAVALKKKASIDIVRLFMPILKINTKSSYNQTKDKNGIVTPKQVTTGLSYRSLFHTFRKNESKISPFRV